MADKPQVQLKLSIPDTDTVRRMIRRDYDAAITESHRLQSIGDPERDADWNHTWACLQRNLMAAEQVAQIFSVQLPRR